MMKLIPLFLLLTACASEPVDDVSHLQEVLASSGPGITDAFRTCLTREGKEECFEKKCLRDGNKESCETKGDPALAEGALEWEPAEDNSEFQRERVAAKASCLKGNLEECATWVNQESQLGKDVAPAVCRSKPFLCERKSEPLKVRPFRRFCMREDGYLSCDISSRSRYLLTIIRRK